MCVWGLSPSHPVGCSVGGVCLCHQHTGGRNGPLACHSSQCEWGVQSFQVARIFLVNFLIEIIVNSCEVVEITISCSLYSVCLSGDMRQNYRVIPQSAYRQPHAPPFTSPHFYLHSCVRVHVRGGVHIHVHGGVCIHVHGCVCRGWLRDTGLIKLEV